MPMNTDSLSPELRAMLACAQVVVDRKAHAVFASALAGCPSVDELCKVAGEQRMLGHLHEVVTTQALVTADARLVERLSELRRATAVRNLRHAGVLLEILGRLDAEGVRALPVKGVVWAQLLYGDLSLRTWSDLDLLVSREQVVTAHRVLLESGFADYSAFNERTVRPRWGSTGQIALGSREFGTVVDLHWDLTVSVSPKGLTFEPVSARADTVDVIGRLVACPGKHDVFLMTCLEGTRDLWNMVARLLDLAVQIDRMSADGWAALLSVARIERCERRVLVAVAHVCGVLDLEIPQPIGERLVGDPGTRALLRLLRPVRLTGMPPEDLRGRLRLIRFQASSEDRRLDRLRFVMARLFAPTTEDWETFTLSPCVEWLYYPLRLVRLGAKWCRRLLRMRR
jgi:hypothetical protein